MVAVLVRCANLTKYFYLRSRLFKISREVVKAVDRVDFSIQEGNAVGLAGESGCGKTTLGMLMLRLMEPTEGSVYFDGRDIFKLGRREMLTMRRNMQIVFQDPESSLNPRMTVEEILSEPLKIHKICQDAHERKEKVAELLGKIGLSKEAMSRYPHELSGGEKQRVAIGRALSLNPRFLILDEPTSALDVSVQAKILNLLRSIKKEFDITYLLISHDLSVIRHVCDNVAIMYLGKLVEVAPTNELFTEPLHPYTETLISSIPNPNPRFRSLIRKVRDEIPSTVHLPEGCRFHPRCPYVMPKCKEAEPALVKLKGEDRLVACHLHSTN